MKNSITLKTVLIYFRENWNYKWLFLATNATWITGMLLQKLILPLIIANTFNQILEHQNNQSLQWSLFGDELILFVIIALISQALIDTGLVLLSRTETKVLVRLSTRVYDFLTRMSTNFHNNTFSGSLVNQTSKFVNAYVGVTDTFVINISQLLIFVVFSGVVLFFYSPLIASTLLIWCLFFVFINLILTKRRIPFSKARARAESRLTGYLADSMANISTIKTFASEKHEVSAYRALAKDRAQKGYIYWMRSIKNDAVYGLLMALLQVLILVVSIYALQTGSIQVGTLILAQVYIAQIISFLWGLSNIAKNLEQNLSDASEMTEILQQEQSVKDPERPEKVKINRGDISFKGVTFYYPEDKKNPLFSNLNLRIKPGEKVGLVGHSGGGKTTITKLLLRFMDIQNGQVTIDNQNIAAITQNDLRSHIAYVPQEPLLFHRSLFENIQYGAPGATKREVIAAAKMAHAHEFIKNLPEGYDTLVGERGVKLSGGQRQRVAIARAMLKNAPILVLDEATSALDSESEALIQDALWKLMENRTAIVIAHRLSTIQKMDRIIVMDKGHIIEQGTHKELVQQSGTYADLWAHQSGGFIEE